MHDRLRRGLRRERQLRRASCPSFQTLRRKARGGKNYYMRGTFTHANTGLHQATSSTWPDLGFTELSMEPVVCAPDDPCALTAEDFADRHASSMSCWRRTCSAGEREGRPITFYHYMIDLTGGPCIYKRISGCGSGTEYMAVTPWGELCTPATSSSGTRTYSLGQRVGRRHERRSCRRNSAPATPTARPDCAGLLGQALLLRRLRRQQPTTPRARIRRRLRTRLPRSSSKRMECAIMLQAASELGDDE